MSAYQFVLTGFDQRFLLEVDALSLAELAQELSCSRFLVGRIIAVDGEATSTGVVVPTSRIGLIAEPD
jgi:hypothetical protein